MPHEIRRVLQAFGSRPWFIEPRKVGEIVGMAALRASLGPRQQPWRAEPSQRFAIRADISAAGEGDAASQQAQTIAVLRLYGPIVPHVGRLEDVSQMAASLRDFGRAFDAAAADPNVIGIVLDIDSPGGTVDLVPETAARIRGARREGRPILAVANTIAASAAYWIASAAEELVVSPSGEVGSIGVYTVHEDVSERARLLGVTVTYIAEGPRKVEGNPFEPLTPESREALALTVRDYYDMFVRDVAKARGVPVSVVKADPEKAEKHFGGGRMYTARRAVDLGMADRVATIEDTIARLQGVYRQRKRKADMARRRLALA
jgi:signal peptide peptidase SppA